MTKQTLLIGLLAVLALVSLIQITRLSNELTEYKIQEASQEANNMLVQQQTDSFRNNLQKAKQIIEQNGSATSFKAVVMETMEFVHNNSKHKIDEKWQKEAFNIPLVVEKLIAVSGGNEEQKPHLSCGPRSYAMKMILEEFGITSRLIGLSSDDFDTILGHRLLEVYNPHREKWEVWDPDFGVTYVDSKTGESVDITELLYGDLNSIVPVNRNQKGWEETKTAHLKANYFEAALFESFYNGMNNSIILVNTKRFDTNKVFKDNTTIYQWAKLNYKNPRLLEFP